MKKRFYTYHRIISLIIAIPVFLWALSGFMHPIMSNFRPNIKSQRIAGVPIDTNQIKVSLKNALYVNEIGRIHNARIVHIDTNWFYQILVEKEQTPIYVSTRSGKPLKNGDDLYARYLAKNFLEGDIKSNLPTTKNTTKEESTHDCCDDATRFVYDKCSGNSAVKKSTIITSFDSEYGNINKILPVHKVAFNRKDSIRIYVETTQDRFVFAVDDKRMFFETLFGLFHTWDWADVLGDFKLYVITILMVLALSSAFMGLYLVFGTKAKSNGSDLAKWRKSHRVVSLIGVLFTIMFTFSGGYHAFYKTVETKERKASYVQYISASQLTNEMPLYNHARKESFTNFSLVMMNDILYWRFLVNENAKKENNQPNWNKSLKSPLPKITFINIIDGTELQDGEKKYALYLANYFHSKNSKNVEVDLVTKFAGEYGFVNKRLPVWKISFTDNQAERVYVETSSGQLAARVKSADAIEGYSFSYLHKHHFMDFVGKTSRDFSTMFWAFFQITMIVVGLTFYFKKRQKSKMHT